MKRMFGKKIAGLFVFLLVTGTAFAQQSRIHGKVSDKNEALPGATVQVVGTNVGTITDAEGN